MTDYVFIVEEVPRNGHIAHDAVEKTSGDRIQLDEPMKSGEYPDIDVYLSKPPHNVKGKLIYTTGLKDEFDQASQKWKFVRGTDTIIVEDMARVVCRITINGSRQ